MKKILISFTMVLALSSAVNAKNVEQTICFSKSDCDSQIAYGVLGDDTNLCSGKCNGKTLAQMNKEGWKLVQIVGGLRSSFGMLLIKEK